MLIGYARVSTEQQSSKSVKRSQDPQLQVTPLESYGCEKVFIERASGAKWEREQLHLMLSSLQPGDQIVVWKLDRLSRSLKDLLEIIEKIRLCGATFKSLTEAIDTSSSAGKMMMQMLGAVAEFERSMAQERTKAGLKNALNKGRKLGRSYSLPIESEHEIINLVNNTGMSQKDVAERFNLNASTVSRIMRRNRTKEAIVHEA